jgi:uncharacterized protein
MIGSDVGTTSGLAFVLVLLGVVNLWVHLAPRWTHLLTGPLAALVLLLAGRSAGLSWTDMGLGREAALRGLVYAGVAAGAIGLVYLVALAVPPTHGAFRDTRYRIGLGPVLFASFVMIPLGTVVFEECAFRGVLLALLQERVGLAWAVGVSSLFFGLWHVLPAIDLQRTNVAVQAAGGRRLALTVVGTVAFTAVAGVLLCELRIHSGSLLAPVGLHWAANGLGALAAARVWAITPTD